MLPTSKLERWLSMLVPGLGLVCAAALFINLDAASSAAERELFARANWLAHELGNASAPSLSAGQRTALPQLLRTALAAPEVEALVVVADSGDTLFTQDAGTGVADRLLALEPGIQGEHVVAVAKLPDGSQLKLAFSAARLLRARSVRDGATLIAFVSSVAIFGLLLLLRRLRPQPAPEPASATMRPSTFAPAPMPASKPQLNDQLLRSIGREARSSLSNAIAMVEVLLDTKLDPKQRRCAQTVEQSARALLSTIDEVLEFARAGDGQYPVRNAEFDLRQAIEDSVDKFAAVAHAKELELLCRIENDVPQFALADADRLRQVLAHVIGNAVKFTERGEVLVHVRMESTAVAGAPAARIEVRDTGPGIAAHEQATVFDGLGGGDELMVRPNRGVGLGLAISKRVIEAMRGTIGVQSTPGAGSCFWLTLPVKAGAKATSLRPIALARRALVVDASRSAREVLKAQIERWQIDCDTTASAYDAFAKLEQEARSPQPFDVVVIAERTSDLSGAELLRAIGSHLSRHQVPVVLLTYKGSALSAAEIDSVAAAQLTKPASPSALHRCITNVVERRMNSIPAQRPLTEARRSTRAEAPRALVVDDNEINQFAVVELLTELGFAPDVARNGREAVEMAARHNYAIVFMDCEMPEMDGYEATREIRRSMHSHARVPIIALTAHNAPEERSKGLAAGMNEYMAKPVRQEALEATLVRWTSTAPEAASVPSPKHEPAATEHAVATESERP